ncbi:protein NRT1/ PTR FAMILY 5.10-like isoform X2 [Senna tora]|uniref:Protein NRT1/ PTR FAMILY 5.10-like isoform X2 n=1 Tax=Senna tora TaxID=362788 RepID=A0A834TNW7_9FABA|nr:protein NRT1/ PTR FAMILY 5.10-like isoform X2 [Senna tora]
MAISHDETPLLLDTVHSAVDFQGRPALRSRSGGWRASAFIVVVEVAEKFAYYAIYSNLINYLTGPLAQSTMTAAVNVNVWVGTVSLIPLLGGFVADSFLGRFRTIVLSSVIYILALGLLTLSATLPTTTTTTSGSKFQVILFFFSLYLVAVAEGGLRPCVQAFGADQFDREHLEEKKTGSSFFNWWNFIFTAVMIVALTIIIFIQENVGWLQPVKKRKLMMAFYYLTNLLKSLDAKAVLRLVPIWALCLIYAVVFSQSSTFFTKQGATMDRKLWHGVLVPAACLQTFNALSIVLFIPIYDRIIVPIARTFTQKVSGITMLQRIGTGMFLSAISMVVAALVEMKRLKMARDYGLVDMPNVTIPMSIWWLIPQYVLFGISDGFTYVGLQEFFYDQVPAELRSVGLSLYLSIFGVGSFLSSFLVSVIQKATSSGDGDHSWFNSNLNRAHLDYFYLLLAALSVVQLFVFLFFSRSYVYKGAST